MNISMRDRIKAGELFTDMCEGLPEREITWQRTHVRI
jgi:galactoside O-acetyltransferase